MRARLSVKRVAVAGLLTMAACDTGQPKVEPPPKTKSIGDLKQSAKTDMTPEELEEARRKAGFKDSDELAKENIAVMAKGEREFVKTRLAEHRELVKGLRGLLATVEKQAPKWVKAKDPKAAYDKFATTYKEDTAALTETYKKLLEGGTQIDIQAKFVGAFRAFENLNGDLGPELAADEKLGKALEDLRGQLDTIEKELEAIEADDSLKVNADYKPEEG